MYSTRPNRRSAATRARVIAAVRALLEEGSFHETTVEQVADRAGVSRATLYQHFGSRVGLIDAFCESFAASAELRAVREAANVEDFVARVVDFWASEEKVLLPLYGAAAVDPAAQAFVDRQRRDRYGELRRLTRGDADAFAALATLTSFETYRELRRHAGRSKRDVVALLRRWARLTESTQLQD